MSRLTESMTALGKLIAANKAEDDSAHLKAIDDHLAEEDGDIADTKAALQALVDAANGTAPAPSPEPTPAAA